MRWKCNKSCGGHDGRFILTIFMNAKYSIDRHIFVFMAFGMTLRKTYDLSEAIYFMYR